MRSSYLSPNDAARIVEALGPRRSLPVRVSLATGLRIGDVLALRASDLDGAVIRYTASKTGKRGEAPIPAELVAELREAARSADGWLFPSPYGAGHLTRQAVWSRIKAAARRAGIDPAGISPHSFRKSFAVAMYRRRGLRATQEALQHSRADITELYALSDFLDPSRLDEPLTRRDLPFITQFLADFIRAALDKGGGA